MERISMNKVLPSLILACCLLASPASAAETPPVDQVLLDPVVVTARGYAASLSETPGSVGVATSRDIAVAPKASLADVLSRIPGISRTGDSPWGQDISIRGLSGPSIVILLNGKRINTATDMNARLGFINPMDVERVEVLKGPVSALYGSGSTGGVVNIITRKADYSEKDQAHGRLAASGSTNPGGGDGYANLSFSSQNAWGLASGAMRDHGNTFGGKNSHVSNSAYSDMQGRAVFGVKPWEKLTVTVEAMQSEGNDIGIPGGVSSMPSLAKVSYPRTGFNFVSMDSTLNVDGDWLKLLEANVYYTTNDRRVRVENLNNAQFKELRPSADHDTVGGKLQSTFEGGGHTLVAGADVWSWGVDSSRTREMHNGRKIIDFPVPDSRQTSTGVFAEDNWKLSDAFTVNIGARLDYVNTTSDAFYNVTPAASTRVYGDKDESDLGWHLHAGLTWKMDDVWSQSALVSSSYRAADIMERFKYINLGGGVELYGNPELDPEQTIYLEYGLHFDKKPFKADLRLFGNIITDYISEKRESARRYTLQNVGDARIYGAELDTRWQFLDNWGLFGNATTLYGRDEDKNQALPGIAPVSGTVGVDYRHGSGFWGRVDTFMAAAQHSTPDGVDDSTGYMTLNAALGYDFSAGGLKHQLSLSVNNILDARYTNYLAHTRGYDVWEPGISALLSYSVEF